MPKKECPKCGAVVSFSKFDTFEKAHKCYPKFAEKIKTKPAVNIEVKEIESIEIPDDGTINESSGEIKIERTPGKGRDKYSGLRD